jgi:pilus assembly protein FimV
MQHGKTPLILMAALALPGAAHALGLGEIHVDSGLNQPLAAEIDIVGATAEDLSGITASVANSETFVRFGADRAAFLSSITFKIARDSKGRPVLAIRSTDTFTEPLVNILIDLRWHGGELNRQYTLLLDPVINTSPTLNAEAQPIVGGPAMYAASAAALPADSESVNETSKPATSVPPNSEQTSTAVGEAVAARKTIKVGARATLRGVAWRVGARADGDLKRMMIAIFHANPNAFEGNINRLRRGVVLKIPSAKEVSAISIADADNEIHAQMESWHASIKFVVAVKSPAQRVSAPHEAVIPAEPVALNQESKSQPSDDVTGSRGNTAGRSDEAEVALGRRVQILEKRLNELQGLLDREQDRLVAVQSRVTVAEKVPAVDVVPTEANSERAVGLSIAAVLALATGAFGLLHAWRRRRTLKARISHAHSEAQDSDVVQADTAVAVPVVRNETSPGAPLSDELHRDVRTEEALLQRTMDEDRQSDADVSPRKLTILEARAQDGVDVESLEASYLWEGSAAAGLEDTVNLADTVEMANHPSATMKVSDDDANAETMPVEAARFTGMPGTSAPENATLARKMSVDPACADTTKLDYNLIDLDASVHHVQMPSMLHESVGFKERRTSLVDALKVAVEREPNRRDLRMKLLETHYAAAAANRQGFLEVVQKLARERGNMTDAEWDKIAWMGRQLAPDNDLFARDTAQTDDEDLADCA